jgi:hypothetical protein
MIDKLSHYSCRGLFGISIALLVLAVLERVLRSMGWTLSFVNYEPGRLIELSALLVVFVIALLLRQIRENTNK